MGGRAVVGSRPEIQKSAPVAAGILMEPSSLGCLKTGNVVSGMQLSIDLAYAVSAKLAAECPRIPKPAGASDESQGSIPFELIASILFSAVCVANHSWKS
jgi:hypothetical protein